MSPYPEWYENLKLALEELRENKNSREVSILITMLEQVIAYAWLWVISK
jgi:hypothetical protein